MFPMIDLQLPLVGAAPPAMMRDLASRRRIDISGAFTAQGLYAFADEAGFWKLYQHLAALPARAEDHAKLLAAVLEQSAATGVVHCEIRLEPAFIGAADLSAWRDSIQAMAEIAKAAEGQITCRLVPTSLRQQGSDLARLAAICAAETAGDFVTGFALAGDEAIGTPADYTWAFDCAREAGLGLAAQAGGTAAIVDTLDALRVGRITGALNVVENLALVEDLAERGIVLDMAPAADIALGHCAGWRKHPLGQLYDRGAVITLSSGAAAFFGTTMPGICENLHRVFDWDEGVFAALAKTALDAAFCDPATKDRIRDRLKGSS